jgi:CheY-like chemotaxis protein
MSTIAITELAEPVPAVLKKKRVLLIDTSPAKRDLRAEVMRRLGMNVDCAADIAEARVWWRADLYDLVLINVERESDHRDRFCADIRNATPPQQLAFLVGKPVYLADSPNAGEESPAAEECPHPDFAGEVKAALSAHLRDLPQRWGLLEASRRIAAVRSASVARTQAMRDRPAPPRDLEARFLKRPAGESRTLDELLREELQ